MIKNSSPRTYYVYVHINKVNGKRYYGITSQLPQERWKRGSQYKQQPKFYNAIQKYGWDNFEHVVLYSGLPKKDASDKEMELIAEFRTVENDYGYNVSIGGEFPHSKYKTAAEAYEVRLEKCRQASKEQWKKICAEPELHLQSIEYKRAYSAKYMEKLKQDPEAYARYLENKRKADQARRSDPKRHAALLAWRREYYKKQKDKLTDTRVIN